MRKVCVLAAVGAMCAMCAFVNPSGASAPAGEGAKEMEFPHAGISVTVPAGFEPQILGEPFDVVRAVKTEKDRPVVAVAVSAYPVAEKDTADGYADATMASLQGALAIKDLKLLSKSPMTVAGITGTARLLSYAFRSSPTVAGRVYFIREIKKPPPRAGTVNICYLLTVEAAADQQVLMRQALGDLVKSVKLIPLQHPADMEIAGLGGTMEVTALGFSIRVPDGWHSWQPTSDDSALSPLMMAQTDYLRGRGGVPTPVLDVVPADVPAGSTAKDLAARAIQMCLKEAASGNLNAKVLSEGPAKLGGVEGYQFVIQEVPSKPVPALPEGEAENAKIKIHRIVCVPGAGGGPARHYALRLFSYGTDSKGPEAIMEKIASGFKIFKPTSAPASAPATTPDSSTKFIRPASGAATAPTSTPGATSGAPPTPPAKK